jgi:gamma-glutamyl hydrolase
MIGIITSPNKYNTECADLYLYTSYINWVEMAEEHAIIIPYNISIDKLTLLLKRLNGIIWVGGEIPNKHYTQKQEDDLTNTLFYCYKYAISETDKGNYYPIWATCLGFDILLMFIKNKSTIISSIKPYPLHGNYPFIFTNKHSKIKKWFSPKLRKLMETNNCVFYNNNYGNDIILEDKIIIVSMHDKVINCIEFKDYPFYGVQFHPEQPKTDLAIKVSNEFINFFVNECKKNKNVWKISDLKK